MFSVGFILSYLKIYSCRSHCRVF